MRLRERLRAARRDDGFTLVELLATVSIMGFVVVGLTGVVISYFKTTVDTQSRMTESQDVQFAAAYWQRDVASIGVRSYDPATKDFVLQQSVGVTPACALPSGTTVATLAWNELTSNDSTDNGQTVTVSYVATGGGSPYELVRVRCTGSTIKSTVEVAHSLNALPTLTCDPGPCTGSGNAVPTLVNLALSIRDPEGNGTAALTATLTGERRQT